jgi:hypothetical protein
MGIKQSFNAYLFAGFLVLRNKMKKNISFSTLKEVFLCDFAMKCTLQKTIVQYIQTHKMLIIKIYCAKQRNIMTEIMQYIQIA